MKRSLAHRIKIITIWILYMPTVGFFFLVTWLDRRLRFSLSFPRDVQQLSERKEWLLAELKKNNTLPADAVIDSCEVKAMNQAVIFRSNAGTVEIKYTTGGAQHTLKCFAKFAPTMGTVWNKTIFNLQLNHIKEAWFNLYFVNQNKNVPAPHVFLSRISILTGNLCLITEHLGDDIEYQECSYAHLPQEHLDMAIDGLASLHAEFWGDTSARVARALPISDTVVDMFDYVVAGGWSMQARDILTQSWKRMNVPQTILHGDSRIGNMMFPSPQGGRYVLIDWQAARRGKGAVDLSYFLILSLISRHRKEVEQASVDTYHRLLLAKGVKEYSRADLEEDYRHGCLCTLVLLSLPLLSGEVSAEGIAAQIFVFGMDRWRERMRIKFEDFDYVWMADRYGMTEAEARAAIAEMLGVIEARLKKIADSSEIKMSLVEILKDQGIPHEFEI